MNCFYLRIFFNLMGLVFIQLSIVKFVHNVDYKNEIFDVAPYPFSSYKLNRPLYKEFSSRKVENSVLKAKEFNIKKIFRYSVEMLKQKSKKIDLVFLIDSSSSVGKANFISEINFVRKLLTHFEISFNSTRIALITYSSHNRVIRHIDQISIPSEDYDQCSAVMDDIPNIKFIGGGTYTYGALKEAKEIFTTARKDSRKYIFLVTDGFSNGKDPLSIAEELKSNNVTIFTVGIKSGNFMELFNISSDPKETHSFFLESFTEFDRLARNALLQDHKIGYSIKLDNIHRCDTLCKQGDGTNKTQDGCCNALAHCECRIPSGHYSCRCPDGYLGEGIGNDCHPCVPNTYWVNSDRCLSCPDINQITSVMPALTINDCVCKPGFKRTPDNRCEGIICPQLHPPENGYFVTEEMTCANVLNAACGVRCKSGYHLLGSSLRLCQENGTWSGTHAQCVLKTCPSLSVPLNTMISCQNHDLELKSYDYLPQNKSFIESADNNSVRATEPMPIDTECTYRCQPGFYLVGSRNRNCLPISKWDGRQTTCKNVLCPPLPKPKYGEYNRSECTKKKQHYGSTCILACPEGFTLKGPKEKQCLGKKKGFWAPKNQISKCIDVTPPKLKCPSSYSVELPDESDSVVLHTLPLPLEMLDSSSSTVTIWTKPSVDDSIGVRLKTGQHVFSYFATDKFNNKANCSFQITVIDKTPPIIENCVDPDDFWLSKDNENLIVWDEPTFVDNSNDTVAVRILSPADPREISPVASGDYSVLYIGVDNSSNYNECLLNITVKDLNCRPLQAPTNGLSYCASNVSHTWCEITCNSGYAIDDKTSGQYSDNLRFTCNHDHPDWGDNAVPVCTKWHLPDNVGQYFIIDVESDNYLCPDENSQSNFTNTLSDKIKDYLCSGSLNCDLITEVPECIESRDDEAVVLGNREKYQISKRDVSASVQKKTKNRSRMNMRIRLFTKIGKHMGLWQKNATLFENIQQMKHQIKSFNTSATLQQALKDLKIDVRKVKIEDFVRCPNGSILKNNICFQCPPGTYQDVVVNRCKLCPLGTYNFGYGQITCTQCPPNQNTKRSGRILQEDCLSECPPGTRARKRRIRNRGRSMVTNKNTLMPFCKKCAIGEYQPYYNKTECLKCPDGFISPRGSASIADCKQQQPHICVFKPNICGSFGECIPETGGYDVFSCICRNGYIGTYCEHKIDLCSTTHCYNGGSCTLASNGSVTSCQCSPDFDGNYCEEFRDSCHNIKCENGGHCVEVDWKAICDCPLGFEGSFCERTVNFCESNPCETGICYNESSGYYCQCPPGIMGRRCHLKPCDNMPCHKNAICVNLMDFPATKGSYECKCPVGLKGFDCSQIIDPCEDNPCKNGGHCQPRTLRESSKNVSPQFVNNGSRFMDFKCICPPYFYGNICQTFTKPDYILRFRKPTILNYVELKGPEYVLKELSFCTWMRSNNSLTYGTIFSYATKESDNAFTLTDYSGFVLYVNGQSSISHVAVNDGLWHFLCVSWTSENGYFELHLDGQLEHVGTNLSSSKYVDSNGILIIGQEQDELGASFSESESFVGEITYLDIWNTFISTDQIQYFYTSCDPYRGSLYSWTDFKENIRGDIDILPSTFCRKCSNNLHLANGLAHYNDNRAFLRCHQGYTFRGSSPVRYCMKTSLWSDSNSYCEKVDCGNLKSIENGRIEYSSRTTFHSIAEYVCNNGYTIDGNNKRVCLSNGIWSGSDAICRSSVQCRGINASNEIRVSFTNDKGLLPVDEDYYPVGVYAEIACLSSTKYYTLTCLDTGKWDVPYFTCDAIETELTVAKTATTPNVAGNSVIDAASTQGYVISDDIPVTERPGSTFHQTTEKTDMIDGPTELPLAHRPFSTTNPSELTSPDKSSLAFRVDFNTNQGFISLFYEFLYQGCADDTSFVKILCELKQGAITFSDLQNFDQTIVEKFPDTDTKLLTLLEEHFIISNQTSNIQFEDFFYRTLYGSNYLNATRMNAELEDTLRYTLCIFIDSLSWNADQDQLAYVEHETLMEIRIKKLKTLLRNLLEAMYADFKSRFPSFKNIPLKTNWIYKSNDYSDPYSCNWSEIPKLTQHSFVKQSLKTDVVAVGTMIEYGCNSNYEIIGDPWISICKSDGQWSEIGFHCESKSSY